MPFDGTQDQAVPVKRSLAWLGIEPVQRSVAERHKDKMLNEFVAKGAYEAMMVKRGQAHWQTCRIVSFAEFKYIEQQLLCPMYAATPDVSGAPKALIDLARTVHKSIPKAEFSIEYFYDDPILNVDYQDAEGQKHHECLGIWNEGELVEIATVTATPLPRKLTFWAQVFKWH
jgi:hypothetical protein